MAVQFKDNSQAIKQQMNGNIKRALTAMGYVGLEMTIDTMNTGYDRKIYQTGELQRSMTFEVDTGKDATTWGTNLDYGPHVHEGTSKMAGRPFLKDGLLEHKDALRDVAAEELRRGFE